jgi:glycosyltransferase
LKISLITAAYNSVRTLPDTLSSVLAQTAGGFEHILVDGGSSDGTVELIRNFEPKAEEKNIGCQWVSEPDNGIYDAMNKGLRMATGKVIGLINSDDRLAGPGVLSKVATAFQDPAVDAVYGDLLYVDAVDPSRVRRVWRSGDFSVGKLRRGWHPAHPTLYLRRSVYEKYGLFDLDYASAADVEFMMRIFSKGIRSVYLPEVLVRMRTGGISNRVSNVWKQNCNVLRGMHKNGIPVSPLFWPAKLLNRAGQFARGTTMPQLCS